MNSDLYKKGITPVDLENDAYPAIDAEATAVYDRKVAAYLQMLRDRESFPLAILWGVSAALFAAMFWTAMSLITGWRSGVIAVAVGAIVGYGVRFGGKGHSVGYRFLGGFLALVGCMLGNLLTIIAFSAEQNDMGFFELASKLTVQDVWYGFQINFHRLDAFFYAFALYEGFKFSARTITEGELERVGMAN